MADFTVRALIYGNHDEAVYFRPLKDFLFKMGLRETQVVSDPREISRLIFDNVWPIVLINHADGYTDGFSVFEGIYRSCGYELVPFLFLAPADKALYMQFSTSAGARGVVKKPIQPGEAERLIRSVLPKTNDQAVMYAIQTSKLLLKGDDAKSLAPLNKLSQVPFFRKQAEVALSRCEIRLGQMLQAKSRLIKLVEAGGKDVRLLCELADFYKRNSQFSNAIEIYNRIHAMHPQMNIKIWDHILMHIELDQLDEATYLLDELQLDPTFKELSTNCLARIMAILGMQNAVGNVLKPHQELLKAFNSYLASQAKG